MFPRVSVLWVVFLLLFVSPASTQTYAPLVTDSCPARTERFWEPPHQCYPCGEGYYKFKPGPSLCSPCDPGSYSFVGKSVCDWCAMGTYSLGTAAMGTLVNNGCQDCPAGKTTCSIGSWRCVTCSPCEAGKFSTTGTACGPCVDRSPTGSYPGLTSCTACPAGTFSSAGQTACSSCAAGKVACRAGMSACDNGCNVAGWTGPDASCSCTACAPGKYKSTSGTMACTSCPAGTFHRPDPLGNLLVANPAYLATSAEAWDAANNRFTDLSGNGRHGVVRADTVFDANMGGPSVWTQAVDGLGAGRTMLEAISSMGRVSWGAQSVPATFTVCSITRNPGGWSSAILSCTDKPWFHGHYAGYGNVGAGCWGYNSLINGVWSDGSPRTLPACSTVESNYWVVACGKNGLAAGATRTLSGVVETTGAVGPGVTGTIINGVVTSTTGGGEGGCQLALNSFNNPTKDNDEWAFSRLYVWNKHLSDADFADASVQLNEFVSSSAYAEKSSVNCKSCPASAPTSLAGSASISECTRPCPPGTTGALDGVAPCTACAAGSFKSTTGSAACTVCPSGTFSSEAGRSACTKCNAAGTMSSVVKPAGAFFHSGDASNRQGWYSAAGTLLDPTRDFTTEGSTTSQDCVCAFGVYKAPNQYGFAAIFAGPCEFCPQGKYREKFAADWTRFEDGGCYDCPVMTFSGTGYKACERCDRYSLGAGTCGTGNDWGGCKQLIKCPAGYTGPDAYCDVCVACAPGSWKTDSGSAACSACAAGKSSPAGATACVTCAAGTFSVAGGVCTECAAGTYSSTSGATACTACYGGASSPAGSTSLGACLCGKGQYLL